MYKNFYNDYDPHRRTREKVALFEVIFQVFASNLVQENARRV